jgi:hypothetical protein
MNAQQTQIKATLYDADVYMATDELVAICTMYLDDGYDLEGIITDSNGVEMEIMEDLTLQETIDQEEADGCLYRTAKLLVMYTSSL